MPNNDDVEIDRIGVIALASMEHFDRGKGKWKPANQRFPMVGFDAGARLQLGKKKKKICL